MKNLIILPILLLIVNITFSQSLNDNEGQRNNKDIIDVESTAPVPEEISKDEIDSPVIINSFNKKSNKKTRTIFSFKQKTKQKYSSKSISKKRTKMSKKNKVRVAFIAGGLLASLLLGVLLYALGIIVVLGLLVIYLAIWPAW
ncbi:MAG: fumarate reductase subunit D [Arenicella sp.]|jgi:fumarate reductase subunit D